MLCTEADCHPKVITMAFTDNIMPKANLSQVLLHRSDPNLKVSLKADCSLRMQQVASWMDVQEWVHLQEPPWLATLT